jgi:glycine cleavage system H protein
MSPDITVKTKLGEYLVKDGLMYTESDEWIKIDENVLTIGVTDYAQKKLRYIVNVELPDIGREVKAGESVVVLESVKTIADVYAPAAGKVIEVNENLYDTPELINKDPYGEGWLVKLELTEDLPKEKLLTPDDYAKKIEKEETK